MAKKNIRQILEIHTLIVTTLKSISELQCTDKKKKIFLQIKRSINSTLALSKLRRYFQQLPISIKSHNQSQI